MAGRKKILSGDDLVAARKMFASGKPILEIAEVIGVNVNSLRRYLKCVVLDKKKCPVCGLLFRPNNRGHKICSQRCRDIKAHKIFREKNPLKINTCCICGKQYHPIGKNKTCSSECSKILIRETTNTRCRKTEREKRKNNIKYRLSCVMRTGIYTGLKGVGVSKRGESSFKLVGYSAEELRLHLEKKFKKGMSWGNYGTAWQIDHILPVSAFIINSVHDVSFRECWALKNLQPLWKEENNKKSAKLFKPFQHQLPMQIGACL